jgi:purine-nucleoside/S-methyl-5'-thioadenosine phosphorylase / adenosine deaminase
MPIPMMFIPEPQPNGAFEWTQAPWGRILQCVPLLALARHFFTTKDLTLRDRVDEWTAVAAWIGVAREDLLLISQVHEASVAEVPADRPRPWPRPNADAIIGNDPTAAIAVRVADCVPILLAEESGRFVAAIHAGWRGMARRVAIAAVESMQSRYGVRPERIVAAVGPCIGPCCYEVGTDTKEAFRATGHHPALLERWFVARPLGKFHLDLWQATRDQLEGAGLHATNIHVAELCTLTHSDRFHSYRADGARAGRMAAVIKGEGKREKGER